MRIIDFINKFIGNKKENNTEVLSLEDEFRMESLKRMIETVKLYLINKEVNKRKNDVDAFIFFINTDLNEWAINKIKEFINNGTLLNVYNEAYQTIYDN